MKFLATASITAVISLAISTGASPIPDDSSAMLEKRTTTWAPVGSSFYSSLPDGFTMNFTCLCPTESDVGLESYYEGAYMKQVVTWVWNDNDDEYLWHESSYTDHYWDYYSGNTDWSTEGEYSCNYYSKTYYNSTGCVDQVQSDYWDSTRDAYVTPKFDCHLQLNVLSYTNPNMDNLAVVEYYIGEWQMFRWYDSRNFAWFMGCPNNVAKAKSKLSKKGPGSQGNPNPDWDFRPPMYRLPFADVTPLSNYDLDFSDPNIIYGATWWDHEGNYVIYNGSECTVMAASRPGLLHQTAVFDESLAPDYQSGSQGNYGKKD